MGVAALGEAVGVDDDEGHGPGRLVVGPEARSRRGRGGRQFGQHALDLGGGRGQHASPGRLVEAGGVGKPLGPVPVRHPGRLGEDGDAEVGRAVVDRRLADQAPEQRPNHGPVADHPETVARHEVETDRRQRQLAQLGEGRGHVGGRLGRRAEGSGGVLQRRGPVDGGRPEAQLEEVVVVPAPFPEMGARGGGPADGFGGVGQALPEAGNLGPAGVDERAPELLQRLLRLGLALSGLLPQPLLVLQVVPRGHGRTEEGESHHGRVDRDPHADPEDSREADLQPAEADAGRGFADGGGKPERLFRRPDGRAGLAVEGQGAVAARGPQLGTVRLRGQCQRQLDGAELDDLVGLQPQGTRQPVALDHGAVPGTEVGQDGLARGAHVEPGVCRRDGPGAHVDLDVAPADDAGAGGER